MATRTRADLLNQILENLGVLAAGQTPELEDTTRVNAELPSILKQLAAEEIVYIPDIEQIPEAYFTPLGAICAYRVRNKFGVSPEEAVELEKDMGRAMSSFKVMTRGKPTYQIQRADYF